ncbi:hypothetical protein FA15DRAFT_315187 [Coprinopsis marcescibilis]|nr:hypothetical protein FA15DRAFT_315187 [Coprinopsis marcescibilis]
MGANFSRMVMQLYIFRTDIPRQANAFTGAENTRIVNSIVNNVAGSQHNVTNIYVPNSRTEEDRQMHSLANKIQISNYSFGQSWEANSKYYIVDL